MIERIKNFWRLNPALRFITIFLGLFILLYYFNLFIIGITSEGKYYSPFIDQHLNYISGLRSLLLRITSSLLEWAGYQVFTSEYTLHVMDHGGFNLVYSCLGFGVMSAFIAFVIAYPKPVKSKLLFIPFGLLLIQILNMTRFILIALFYRKNFGLLGGIDHHTIYNTLVYIILGFSIYLWINFQVRKSS